MGNLAKVYTEGKHSTFTSFGATYLVDDALEESRNTSVISYSIDQLDWVIPYSSPDLKRVDSADLTYPVIITEQDIGGEIKLVVIDGLHRLMKAKQLGRSVISGKQIRLTNLTPITTLREGYR